MIIVSQSNEQDNIFHSNQHWKSFSRFRRSIQLISGKQLYFFVDKSQGNVRKHRRSSLLSSFFNFDDQLSEFVRYRLAASASLLDRLLAERKWKWIGLTIKADELVIQRRVLNSINFYRSRSSILSFSCSTSLSQNQSAHWPSFLTSLIVESPNDQFNRQRCSRRISLCSFWH